MKTATTIVQSALKVFNLRLVRRDRFDQLCAAPNVGVGLTWHEPVWVEPGVGLALRDLVRPGDTCFDVGAFDGTLTQVMSRAAGPRGRVCAFEANPGTLAALTRACSANAMANVHLVHAAIWHTTGEWVTMHAPPGVPVAASIAGPANETDTAVPTLALDDYVRRYELHPNVVKMDIEGAEEHALTGFLDTLARHKPHLILEQRTKEIHALDLVRELGYDAFDAGSYEDIRTANDFPTGSAVRNVVCVHRDRLSETAYAHRRPRRLVREFAGVDLVRPDEATWELELRLPPGRFVVEIDATADRNAILTYELHHNRALRGKFAVAAWWLLANARDMPFHTHNDGTVKLCFGKLEGPGTVHLKRLRLFAVDGVAPVPPLGDVV